MRTSVGFWIAIATTIIGTTGAGWAQSAYDYPWCALRATRSGGQSCYFTSYQQCMETLSGIGGICIRSPYYHEGPRPHHPSRYIERY